MLNSNDIRQDFPILTQQVNNYPLVYLDSAATSQKPQQVIDCLIKFYSEYNANIHRGVHTLGNLSTEAYEAARDKVQAFIHAQHREEIIFTRSTTTALNMVARMLEAEIQADDEIVISLMEHHANTVPWQEVAKRTGAKLKYIDLDENGQLTAEAIATQLTERTKVVAIAHVSNVLGTINDVQQIAAQAHAVGAYIVVDAAQSVPHQVVDVTQLDCDFLAFSGHKMLAPTGIGVLYGKKQLLERLSPVEFGGDMIEIVELDQSTWAELPTKFEAGTPNIAQAIALGAAIDYLNDIGMANVEAYIDELTAYAYQQLSTIDDLEIYGPPLDQPRGGLITFNVKGIHPHDLSTVLDTKGIAIRAGHHCAQPLMRWLQQGSTARASFYIYNTKEEIDALVTQIKYAKEFFEDVPF